MEKTRLTIDLSFSFSGFISLGITSSFEKGLGHNRFLHLNDWGNSLFDLVATRFVSATELKPEWVI